ncbi:MAG TPA: HAD hydrolase-like protein [Verrucomicrobiae bacterium]|jgi:phosphonatase-like hydrolase|nr:HAD hydrolase-like protein [Verrucomicrobiae bacterium]
MSIQLAIFDMAGTTVRDDDAVNICLRDALAAEVSVTRDEINSVMGLPKPIAIRLVLEKKLTGGKPADSALVGALHADFLRRMLKHYQDAPGIEPMPHAVDTFLQLKRAGVRIALDTGFSRPIVNAILERLGWNGTALLDATVASDEVAQGRPHADLAFKAMELTGVRDSGRVAKVGDTPSDLQEGTAAGCRWVIGVTNGTHTREQLAGSPHTHLISSLAELPAIVLA